MTPIDTAALRALADRFGAVGVNLSREKLRALCDGYDEAQRLQVDVEVSDGLTRTVIAAREHSERVLTAQRDAARQALVDLVADLRALCDEWDGYPEDERGFVSTHDLRAVIDRHVPATPTTEEDR